MRGATIKGGAIDKGNMICHTIEEYKVRKVSTFGDHGVMDLCLYRLGGSPCAALCRLSVWG